VALGVGLAVGDGVGFGFPFGFGVGVGVGFDAVTSIKRSAVFELTFPRESVTTSLTG
jgi:hypothetical protein